MAFKAIKLVGEPSSRPAPQDSIVNTSNGDGDGLHLFLEGAYVMDLPESGEITFKFRRGPRTASEAGNGRPARAHADLSLFEICNVVEKPVEYPEHDDEEDEEEGTESRLDRLFSEAREDDEGDEAEEQE